MEEWEKNLSPRQRANVGKVKASPYYQEMIDRGFIPFTPEWRKESLKLTKRQYARDNRERLNAQRRKRQKENIEKVREEWRKKSAKRRKDPEKHKRIRELWNRRYHANRQEAALKEKLRRWRREPHRAIRSYTDLYIKGLCSYEQYIEQINEYTQRAERLSCETSGANTRRGKSSRVKRSRT